MVGSLSLTTLPAFIQPARHHHIPGHLQDNAGIVKGSTMSDDLADIRQHLDEMHQSLESLPPDTAVITPMLTPALAVLSILVDRIEKLEAVLDEDV